MTLPFAAIVFGLIVGTAAIKNTTITSVLQGAIHPGTSAFNIRTPAQVSSAVQSGIQTGENTAAGATVGGAFANGAVPSGVAKGLQLLKGLGTFDGHPVALWIIPYLKWARAHGWRGSVVSGYRSTAEQRATCATGVRPCAAPGTSNHQGTVFPGGAVDVSDPDTLESVLKRYPGGHLLMRSPRDAKGKLLDPPHFSFHHNGSY